MNEKLAALRRASSGDTKSLSPQKTSPQRRILIGRRLLIGAAVALAVLLVTRFGGRFLPAKAVVVETVLAVEGEASTSPQGVQYGVSDPFAGSVRFQSSGWIEADPFLIKAAALVSGVVRDVHFLEGQAVQAGEILVTLIQEDAHINLLEAQQASAAAMAAVDIAIAEREVALARWERMGSEVAAARSRLEELTDLARRAEAMGPEVIPEQEIAQAGLRVVTQAARLEAMEAEQRQQRAEVERAEARLVLAQRAAGEAEQRLARRELEWTRTEVRAPVSGIVQRLFVVPGQKRMLAADDPESATVAWMYDPERLQARIDVPLAEAAGLFVGQAVLVESELLPGKAFEGQVTRIVGEADLQRNTLQVKVALLEPDRRLRPEMLCRAKFLDTAVAGQGGMAVGAGDDPSTAAGVSAGPRGGLILFAPESALTSVSGSKAEVLVVDASGRRAEARALQLGPGRRGAYVEVRAGLRPGDRVIVEPSSGLKPGSRINPFVKGE